jgi:hypothetical protein
MSRGGEARKEPEVLLCQQQPLVKRETTSPLPFKVR